jgi:hypothetical protein
VKMCDHGGLYYYPEIPGPAVLQPRCEASATVRYRSPGTAAGYWGHRCAPHAGMLDRSVCTIEPLESGAEQ